MDRPFRLLITRICFPLISSFTASCSSSISVQVYWAIKTAYLSKKKVQLTNFSLINAWKMPTCFNESDRGIRRMEELEMKYITKAPFSLCIRVANCTLKHSSLLQWWGLKRAETKSNTPHLHRLQRGISPFDVFAWSVCLRYCQYSLANPSV